MGEIGMNNQEHEFNDSESLVDSLSEDILDKLEKAILKNGKASLLVSGGSTPKPLFKKLSLSNISWNKVSIALCDERWVTSEHKDSNEKLVKDYLLVNNAVNAKFVPMYQKNIAIKDSEQVCSNVYKKELFPFDVLILGMGNDGHTASLFPKNIELKKSFDTEEKLCISMTPSDAPHERMSLTKKAILSTKNLYLHFEGEEKRKVYKTVLEGIDSYEMPIASILNDKKKVEVYYK